MNQSNVKTLMEAIGERLLALRSQSGKLQEDIATAARLFGLDWSRSTVAAIETGKRDLSIGEFVMLPSVLSAAVNHRVTLSDLVPEKERLRLSTQIIVRPGVLNKVLSGVGPMQADADFTHGGLEVGREMAEARKLGLSRRGLRSVKNDAASDAVIKIARKVRVEPFDIAIAAYRRWGHGLTDERDRRISAQDVEPRSLQALRGHITRELLRELEPDLKAKGGKK